MRGAVMAKSWIKIKIHQIKRFSLRIFPYLCKMSQKSYESQWK